MRKLWWVVWRFNPCCDDERDWVGGVDSVFAGEEGNWMVEVDNVSAGEDGVLGCDVSGGEEMLGRDVSGTTGVLACAAEAGGGFALSVPLAKAVETSVVEVCNIDSEACFPSVEPADSTSELDRKPSPLVVVTPTKLTFPLSNLPLILPPTSAYGS
jgi:hypothetical protein